MPLPWTRQPLPRKSSNDSLTPKRRTDKRGFCARGPRNIWGIRLLNGYVGTLCDGTPHWWAPSNIVGHGQPLFRIELLRNRDVPDTLYGVGSNYQMQGLKLAKQFS